MERYMTNSRHRSAHRRHKVYGRVATTMWIARSYQLPPDSGPHAKATS